MLKLYNFQFLLKTFSSNINMFSNLYFIAPIFAGSFYELKLLGFDYKF